MDYQHIDTYEDLDTGDMVEEYEDTETGDIIEYRNAVRDNRSDGGSRRRPATRRRRPRSDRTPRERTPARRREPESRATTRPRAGENVSATGEYITIKKSFMGDLIPIAGKLWASMLGKPGNPSYSGDPRVDYDNASMHREALAEHEQNQLRIMAYSDVAGRLLKLFMN